MDEEFRVLTSLVFTDLQGEVHDCRPTTGQEAEERLRGRHDTLWLQVVVT